jgi:hypothetical protein
MDARGARMDANTRGCDTRGALPRLRDRERSAPWCRNVPAATTDQGRGRQGRSYCAPISMRTGCRAHAKRRGWRPLSASQARQRSTGVGPSYSLPFAPPLRVHSRFLFAVLRLCVGLYFLPCRRGGPGFHPQGFIPIGHVAIAVVAPIFSPLVSNDPVGIGIIIAANQDPVTAEQFFGAFFWHGNNPLLIRVLKRLVHREPDRDCLPGR